MLLYKHLCVALQLKRCLPCNHYSASHTKLLPKVLGKVPEKDACPEKFSLCLIIDGCPIAKVVPDSNEWVLNNVGLGPNNV